MNKSKIQTTIQTNNVFFSFTLFNFLFGGPEGSNTNKKENANKPPCFAVVVEQSLALQMRNTAQCVEHNIPQTNQPSAKWDRLAYTTSTVRDTCTFALFCWVTRPSCRFTHTDL